MAYRGDMMDITGDDPPLRLDSHAGPRAWLADGERRPLVAALLAGLLTAGLASGVWITTQPHQGTHDFRFAAQDVPGTQSGRIALDAGAERLRDTGGQSGKADRVVPAGEEVSALVVIAVNTTVREGERDHIHVRPYAWAHTALVTHADPQRHAHIPPYDPLAMYPPSIDSSNSQGEILDAIFQTRIDSEVVISVVDFPQFEPGKAGPELPMDAVLSDLGAYFGPALDGPGGARPAQIPDGPGGPGVLAYASPEPVTKGAVRITQENVTFVGKQDDILPRTAFEEEIVVITAPAGLRDTLLQMNLAPFDVFEAVNVFGALFGIGALDTGHTLKVARTAPIFASRSGSRIERISLYENLEHVASIARSDDGRLVQARAPSDTLSEAVLDTVSVPSQVPLSLYESIYHTGLELELDEEIILDLLRIFSFDVDYRTSTSGDFGMELFFAMADEATDSEPEIHYAALHIDDIEHRFYRFRPQEGEPAEYFDETGNSARKFLIRKPLLEGRFTSGYGMRIHPILGVRKMHNGVDWAARRGTPIMAAGDGVVTEARWRAGYGRRVSLRHNNGYVTTYSHMTRIADSIRPGAQVTQGQVIGYVGSTGLSTGPHLHYEIIVDGRYVDPMGLNLPRDRELSKVQLARFDEERRRLDRLLERARTEGTPGVTKSAAALSPSQATRN